MAKSAASKKPKITYKEEYRKGVYETNRTKVAGWVANPDVQMELVSAGIMDNETEFVTITFKNLPH